MYTQGQGVPSSPSQARMVNNAGLNVAPSDVNAYTSARGAVHSYSSEEVRAFTDYFNNLSALRQDPQLAAYLPIPQGDHDAFFRAFEDGVLLCKLINVVKPGMIDAKHITVNPKGLAVYHKTQNLNTAIAACHEMGMKLVNIGAEDVMKQVRHLALSLIWQVVRHSLLSHINLKEHPELVVMYEQREDVHALLNGTPEEGILRWINYHLKRAGCPRQVRNFTSDIQDGEVYMALMSQIAPNVVPQEVRREVDPKRRADMAVHYAKQMGVETFVTPNDILTGNKNLNLAFCADMFNKYPGIQVQNFDEMQQRTIKEAEEKLRIQIQEEERARRERWAWEEEQRKQQWAQEDATRRAQLAAEEASRMNQKQSWDEESRRRELEKQKWQQEDQNRRLQAEEEEKKKEEQLRMLEEQTRQLTLQTQRAQYDAQQMAAQAAQAKAAVEAQQLEAQKQQQLMQQQMEQQRLQQQQMEQQNYQQQQQLQMQQQQFQQQQQQYNAMQTQPQSPVPQSPVPQQQPNPYAMNPYATAPPVMNPYMTQQQMMPPPQQPMYAPTMTVQQQYPPPMMYQQTTYAPPPPTMYQTTTVYQPPPPTVVRTTVTTTRTAAPPTVMYQQPSVTVIHKGKYKK